MILLQEFNRNSTATKIHSTFLPSQNTFIRAASGANAARMSDADDDAIDSGLENAVQIAGTAQTSSPSPSPDDDLDDSPDAEKPTDFLQTLKFSISSTPWAALLERGTGLLATSANTLNQPQRALVWSLLADRLKSDAPEEGLHPLLLDALFQMLPRYTDRASRSAAQRTFLALATANPNLLPKIIPALDRARSSKGLAGNTAGLLSVFGWTLGVLPLVVKREASELVRTALMCACETAAVLPAKLAKQATKLMRSAVIRCGPSGAKSVLKAGCQIVAKSAEVKFALAVVPVLDVAEHKKWDVVGKSEVETVAAFFGNVVLGSKTPIDETELVRLLASSSVHLVSHSRTLCSQNTHPFSALLPRYQRFSRTRKRTY
jgi:hypothetical protein